MYPWIIFSNYTFIAIKGCIARVTHLVLVARCAVARRQVPEKVSSKHLSFGELRMSLGCCSAGMPLNGVSGGGAPRRRIKGIGQSAMSRCPLRVSLALDDRAIHRQAERIMSF